MHEPYRSPAKLEALLKDAIRVFNDKDAPQLLAPNDRGAAIHERTIVHRLAYHLERRIREDGAPEIVTVDCEYNRFGRGRKFLHEMEGFCEAIAAAERTLTLRGELSILPDIIVHERGEDGPNYLVVEVKKDSNATDVAVRLDQVKLERLTTPGAGFDYALGVELRARDGAGASRQLEILGTWTARR